MNGDLLTDRAVGCLAGAAVGDALGGATEGWESHEIQAHFGGWVDRIVESIRAHAEGREGRSRRSTRATAMSPTTR